VLPPVFEAGKGFVKLRRLKRSSVTALTASLSLCEGSLCTRTDGPRFSVINGFPVPLIIPVKSRTE
jgi:hypothetical protein